MAIYLNFTSTWLGSPSMRPLLPLLAALMIAAPAWAGDLSVSLKTPSGAPRQDQALVQSALRLSF
jgi:hypothetical protein